ncbi:MAG: lipoamide acyltransferase component of branched-chain alpha-keto acid dehydrogenase complex [Dehalococcoidia bacterium]|nr:MAG: lipoamide acyltransferase component of branched-chain alpha-keto acid dehydrogenase complex [Dehalococcoidia bacterium]
MRTTVSLPPLGESIVEGVIDHWLRQPGEEFQAYEPLVEVVTDKVNAEVPAPFAGKLVEILAQPGQTVAVGAPIAIVETSEEVAAPVAGAPPTAEAPAPPAAEAAAPPPEPAPAAAPSASPPPAQPPHSPSVAMLAQALGVDLSKVKGTGMGGRITRRDVLSYVEREEPESEAPSPAAIPPSTAPVPPPAPAPAPAPAPVSAGRTERRPLTAIRRLIAENVSRSKSTIPHAWQAQEVDMSKVVAFRNRVKDEFRRREGVSLTYVPFVIKAACEALRENPRVNSQWDGDAIIEHGEINIGVAVGTEDSLVVPVIRNADSLSLAGIARALADLTERARTGKLTVQDLQGGTFTVNNVGTFGTIISYSIINPPQAGILTMEAVVDRVVVVDGMIAVRPMMFLCFSFDHRVLDGLQAARFLSSVRRRLEAFDPETAELY